MAQVIRAAIDQYLAEDLGDAAREEVLVRQVAEKPPATSAISNASAGYGWAARAVRLRPAAATPPCASIARRSAWSA